MREYVVRLINENTGEVRDLSEYNVNLAKEIIDDDIALHFELMADFKGEPEPFQLNIHSYDPEVEHELTAYRDKKYKCAEQEFLAKQLC